MAELVSSVARGREEKEKKIYRRMKKRESRSRDSPVDEPPKRDARRNDAFPGEWIPHVVRPIAYFGSFGGR